MNSEARSFSQKVLVLQHTEESSPAYLAKWLNKNGIRWDVRCTALCEHFPSSAEGYDGIAVLGGEWSANDDRPSLRQAEVLIREADARGIPVIGHCLGGQLMARAFGGKVGKSPQPEVGWLPIGIARSPSSEDWFGNVTTATVYQWHYESFVELPPGAELVATSPGCPHQAFVYGQHLAMQFHIEIDIENIDLWTRMPDETYEQALRDKVPTVHSREIQLAATRTDMAGSEALADSIYSAWRLRWQR